MMRLTQVNLKDKNAEIVENHGGIVMVVLR